MSKQKHDLPTPLPFREQLIIALASNSCVYHGDAREASRVIKLADQIIQELNHPDSAAPGPIDGALRVNA